MKILFVENRYASWLAGAVAARLQADGHEVHWIIQNPLFETGIGMPHVVPFPQGDTATDAPLDEALLSRIAASDRQIRYFGKTAVHYAHYFARVGEIINDVRPDVVFGESTQFYELLTIEHCRRKGIQYLNPVSIGYPHGRLCFFSLDSKCPFGGVHTVPDEGVAAELVKAINQRRIVPSYMSSASVGLPRLFIRLGDWIRITRGWILGERYATPSPMRKIALALTQRRLRRNWDALAKERSLEDVRYVLYALHVQPECSIDVWGYP